MNRFRDYIIDNCCCLKTDFDNIFILYKRFIEQLISNDFKLLNYIDESLVRTLYERNI